jgi:quercetin dioxygenase-like cupin family protein
MVSLATGEHAVYRLAPDLLLVFKPRTHREPEHAHAYRQRLRVLRGTLKVETVPASVVLDCVSPAFTVAAGQPHATEALEDTWLVAEITPPNAF